MMEKQIKIETLLPFGPPILKTTIPSYVVDNLNAHCDETLADEQKLKDYDYSGQLAGNVKKEFKLSGEFLNKEQNFSNILRKLAERMIALDVRGTEEQLGVSYLRNAPPSTTNIARKYITGCQVLTVWCVSQWGGDFNPLHIHSGDLSGVLYLKVPEGLKRNTRRKIITHRLATLSSLQVCHRRSVGTALKHHQGLETYMSFQRGCITRRIHFGLKIRNVVQFHSILSIILTRKN